MIFNAIETAKALPYPALAAEIAELLQDPQIVVPERLVQALPGGGSLFVMPASDARLAITKLISFTPANAALGLPTIQGDVIVFDVATGKRLALLDGPCITARRTAAVSLLAAQKLAANTNGPLLIVGAGVQGKAHLEAFAVGLGLTDVVISSRSHTSAQRLADHARTLGLNASITTDPNAAMKDCPLIVTCTPASSVVLHASPRRDAFLAAVGAFKPEMVELSPSLCRHFAQEGRIVVDTASALHEAGDLLQAGIAIANLPTLSDVARGPRTQAAGPVLFKSCGWAGWDLAAARLAIVHSVTAT